MIKNKHRNYLAFWRNNCYQWRVFKITSLLKMLRHTKLIGAFGSAAAAALAFAPAHAEDAPAMSGASATAEATSLAHTPETNFEVEYLEDADRPANEWVVGHPDRMAISVHAGTETPEYILANIEPLLRQHFAANGLDDLEFFWERSTGTGTTLAYHTDHYVWGPYGLGNALDFVPEAARGTIFNRDIAMIEPAN